MKLAVPLSAPGEAAILFRAGATEFYCGVQTLRWQSLYGNHDSISRRQGAANLASLDELETVVKETAALRAPLFLTVNGNYSEAQLPAVVSAIDAFEDMGGAGIMITDIALLSLLNKRGCRLTRGLSLLAAVSSRSAMEFYIELGVSRVVFPRFLRPEDIGGIMRHYPHIQAEAIVWIDKCGFIDGYCRFLHTVGYQDYQDYQGSQVCLEGHGSAAANRSVFTYDTGYRLPACFELLGAPPFQLPACAACYLAALAKAGVSIFKLGGRGRPMDVRLSGVNFLTAAGGKAGADEKGGLNCAGEIKALYAKTFGSACNAEVCYYSWSDL